MHWIDKNKQIIKINYLEQQALLSSVWVTLFCYFVSRPSNLYKPLNVDSRLLWSWLCWCILGFLGSSLCSISTTQNLIQHRTTTSANVMKTVHAKSFKEK